jgi:hypothetical protein
MSVVAVADREKARISNPSKGNQLSFFDDARSFGAAVTAREFFHTSSGVDKFLFPGEKRMASGADADFNVAARGTGMIDGAARTGDISLVIFRMNVRFHVWKRARNLAALDGSRKR